MLSLKQNTEQKCRAANTSLAALACGLYMLAFVPSVNSEIICHAMLGGDVLCCAVLCYAMLCYAVLCCAMLCYAMLCYAMLCYIAHRSFGLQAGFGDHVDIAPLDHIKELVTGICESSDLDLSP